MNKNSIGAIAIIVLLFGAFIFINHKSNVRYQAELAAYEERMSVLEAERAERESAEALLMGELVEGVADSTSVALQKAKSVMMIGESLTEAKIAKGEVVTLQNDLLTIELSTKGAQPKSVTLKDFTKYAPKGERTELIEMFDPSSAKMDMSFYIRNGLNNVKVNTSEYTFAAGRVEKIEGAQRQSFVLDFGEGASLEYIYTLYNSEDESRSYMLDFDVKFHNMTPIMANQTAIAIDWQNKTYQNERGFTNENTYTTLSYHFEDERGISELGVSTEDKSKNITGKINWVAFKQQFFTSAFVAPSLFSTADVAYSTAEEGSGYMKSFSSQMTVPYTTTIEEFNFALYYGPNQYYTLKGTEDLGYGDLRMQELVPLGWGIFGWVNKFFTIPVFDFLREHIHSFGIIILILAVLVKLIISPMTYNSYVSMAKMRVLKPEVDQITAKYPNQDDAMKRQQATMELYKKVGVNPMGGCLPMLIQMPIIIAMFRFFPASIELRDQSFLWAHDLSSYDSVLQLPFNIPFYGDHVSLFALLMAVVMFFYSKINYEQSASSQPQMAGMKFMMVYMMPVMMLLWFNSYSSGLCYYYFLANLLTIAQTLIIRRMVDDDKIHAILKANAAKKKNSKKSKFQQRYEAMMAEAQAQQNNKKR
ncbi:MAG: membrane protein insertase YidC [Rikenellaceae bacterium]